MNFAIDTNRYTDFARGLAEAVEQFGRSSTLYVPVIVLGELRAGFAHGTRAMENEKRLVSFLREPRTAVLAPDDDTTHHYAMLFKHLKSAGSLIPTNDIWIAALCHQHSLPLYTRDDHFNLLPMIATI